MADDYDIAINVRPGDAIPAIARVADALGKAETAGARVGDAISRNFVAGARAADSVRDSHGRLVAGLGHTALAFESVARAVQREQLMLDKINGPARKYEQHLQTLDSLLGKNAISTQQYVEQVTRLNRELERNGRLGASRAPGVPAAAGGLLQRATGGLDRIGEAVSPARAVAAGVIGLGAREILGAANSYQELQNRMRVVASDGESVAATFGRINTLAVATRSNLESTTIAYQRLRGATAEMGLSSNDLLRVTERINKAIKVSGAAADEAAAASRQLAQGIASGRLQGDELRSIMENAPYVARIIADSLGVSIGKLRELGSQGKLTSDVVVNAFEKMGSKIDTDFAKTVPTLGEQWVVFKDKLTVTIGKIFEATGLFQILGTALGGVGQAVGFVGDIFGVIGKAVGGVRDVVLEFASAFKSSAVPAVRELGVALEYLLNPLALVKDGITALKDLGSTAEAQSILRTLGQGMVQGGLGDLAAAAGARARAYIGEMEAMKKLLAEEAKLERVERTLAAVRSTGVNAPVIDVEQAQAALRLSMQVKQIWGVDIPPAFTEATKKGLEFEAAVKKIGEQRVAKQLAEDMERTARALHNVSDALDDQQKHWRGLRDQLADVNRGIAQIEAMRAAIAAKSGVDPNIQMHGKGNQDALNISRDHQQLLHDQEDITDALANSDYQYGKVVEESNKALRERKRAVESVTGAIRDGRLTGEAAALAWKNLGLEEDRATKILKEIRQPTTEYSANVAALNTLLNHGKITLDEYGAAIKRVTDAYAGSEFRELLEAGTRTPKLPTKVSLGGGPVADGLFDDAIDWDRNDANVSRERLDALRKYEEDVARATSEYGVGRSPDEPNLEKDLAGLEAYEESLEKAAEASRTFESGLDRGLAKVKDNITDVAGATENLLVNAFQNAENALVQFVTTGEFSFSKMVDSMLADLTRLLFRQAMAGIIGGIGGGGGANPVDTGMGLLGNIFGGAHAFGGSYRVGGSGPPDSQLVSFRLTPGEHVQFTPPGQTPAAASGGGQAPPVNVYVVDSKEEAMRRWAEEEGESYHHVYERRRDSGAKRGRTTGR